MTGTDKGHPRRYLPDHAVSGPMLPEFARWTLEESVHISHPDSPFSGTLAEGDPRLLVIVGENASGKSLAFRIIARLAEEHGVDPITISIRERVGSGNGGMENMRKRMIFGDEGRRSTGATSAAVVERAFDNLDHPMRRMLGLDEPELGLSDGYAEALGEYVGRRSIDQGPKSCGVMVVTHSRRFCRGLLRGFGTTPAFLSMTAATPTIQSWLDHEEIRSVEEILGLSEFGRERHRRVDALLGR